MTITLEIGEKILEIEEGKYLVRLNGQIIIPPLLLEIMKTKLKEFKYRPNERDKFQSIYNVEEGALEDFVIEEEIK